jgi:hypothetical protein
VLRPRWIGTAAAACLAVAAFLLLHTLHYAWLGLGAWALLRRGWRLGRLSNA